MTDNDNGKKGVVSPAPPHTLRDEDIQTQVAVIITKQGGRVLLYSRTPDGTPDIPLALELLANGLGLLSAMMRQSAPQEAKRIVLVPGVPPGIDLRGKAGT